MDDDEYYEEDESEEARAFQERLRRLAEEEDEAPPNHSISHDLSVYGVDMSKRPSSTTPLPTVIRPNGARSLRTDKLDRDAQRALDLIQKLNSPSPTPSGGNYSNSTAMDDEDDVEDAEQFKAQQARLLALTAAAASPRNTTTNTPSRPIPVATTAASPPPPPGLSKQRISQRLKNPPLFVEYMDPKTGAPYWHCPETNETSWINPHAPPPGLSNPPPPPATTAKAAPAKATAAPVVIAPPPGLINTMLKQPPVLEKKPSATVVAAPRTPPQSQQLRKSLEVTPTTISASSPSKSVPVPATTTTTTTEKKPILSRQSVVVAKEAAPTLTSLYDAVQVDFWHLLAWRNIPVSLGWTLIGFSLLINILVLDYSVLAVWSLTCLLRILVMRVVSLTGNSFLTKLLPPSSTSLLPPSSPLFLLNLFHLFIYVVSQHTSHPDWVYISLSVVLVVLGLVGINIVFTVTGLLLVASFGLTGFRFLAPEWIQEQQERFPQAKVWFDFGKRM